MKNDFWVFMKTLGKEREGRYTVIYRKKFKKKTKEAYDRN